MSEHLSNRMLKSYRQGAIPVAELPKADEHLAACAECRRKLGEAAALGSLAGFFQGHAEHLSYEETVAFIQGEPTSEGREQVASHVASCERCRFEVEDLRAFAGQFAAYPATRLAPAQPRSFWQRMLAATGFAALRDQLTGSTALGWQLAGATVAVLIAVLAVAFLLRREPQAPPIAKGGFPSPTVITTVRPQPVPSPSSPDQVTPAPLPVTTPIAPELPPQVMLALRNERLELPSVIGELAGKGGNLMGEPQAGASFALIGPAATIVNTARPTLRWQPLAGATGYSVKVFNADYDQVASAAMITATQWTLDKPLARGRSYSWQVTAHKEGKEIIVPTPPAPAVKFRVLEKAKADELAQARRSYGNNPLVLGVLYAQAGLLEEAEREFNEELKANPHSAKAKKLLADLRRQRRPQ